MKFGYLDKVDYDYELGEALGGSKIYPSIADLKKNQPCVVSCGIVKVKIKLMKVIKKSNFSAKPIGKKVNQKCYICIDNKGYEVSLEKGKIYLELRKKEDIKARRMGLIRIIDEDEDYLYDVKRFSQIVLPISLLKKICPKNLELVLKFEKDFIQRL